MYGLARYDELVRQHGKLEPLVEVSLRPQTEVQVTIRCGETSLERIISVYSRVVDLKKELEPQVGNGLCFVKGNLY